MTPLPPAFRWKVTAEGTQPSAELGWPGDGFAARAPGGLSDGLSVQPWLFAIARRAHAHTQ